jgi:hypothetical protein
MSQNDTGVRTIAGCPRNMNRVKVSYVERVQDTVLCGAEAKMILIRPADHAKIGCSQYIYLAGAEAPNEITVHGVFV